MAKVDPGIYDSYVGQYEFAHGVIYTITKEGNKLFWQITDQTQRKELLPLNENTFFSDGISGQMVFVRNSTGKVTEIILREADSEVKARKIR